MLSSSVAAISSSFFVYALTSSEVAVSSSTAPLTSCDNDAILFAIAETLSTFPTIVSFSFLSLITEELTYPILGVISFIPSATTSNTSIDSLSTLF